MFAMCAKPIVTPLILPGLPSTCVTFCVAAPHLSMPSVVTVCVRLSD